MVWKLDRLGRHLRHLVNLVGDRTKRGIGLKVLAGEGISIDTADGRLVFAILAEAAMGKSKTMCAELGIPARRRSTGTSRPTAGSGRTARSLSHDAADSLETIR